MNKRIVQAITKLFERHRIIFWYDSKHELRTDFEELSLSEVKKIELVNNEYAVKHRILREEPDQKFLLYREDSEPDEIDNWLLDVQLANNVFRTDQVAIWLSDLELGMEFADLIQDHAPFFQVMARIDALKPLIKGKNDSVPAIKLKMLAVCTNSEPRLDAVLEYLLQEASEGTDERFKLIELCKLDKFLWECLEKSYDYYSSERSIRDFLSRMFRDCYEMEVEPEKYLAALKENAKNNQAPSRMSQAIQVFIKRWKDSRQFEDCYEVLSKECSELLGIEDKLSNLDFREVINLDYFELIDKKIIYDLVHAVSNRTVSAGDVAQWVRQRRQGHWYRNFQDLYEAIDYAAQFMHRLSEVSLTMESLSDGLQRYKQNWYKLDQLYRKFTYHVQKSGQASLMGTLTDQVENFYSTSYLLKVNNKFQEFVDGIDLWSAPTMEHQWDFFDSHVVKDFLDKNKKVCVIISDAMRYEIGDELLKRIQHEDRFTASLTPAMSVLPSYTQLGMAALLPHKELEICDNDTSAVMVDSQNSQGLNNRIKILEKALPKRVTACKATDVFSMRQEECRTLIRNHDVVYIYHNGIDSVGDKRESEGQVFESVEKSIQEVIRLIKKLTGENANNLLVTADHGFIYQDRAIDESDFTGNDAQGDKILFRDRRFVLGHGLHPSASLHSFTSEQLGLSGSVAVQIPKSINRLRLKGSGSRYVHGGASLQEVVIPVLKVNKKRSSDVSCVDVDFIQGTNSIISTGQIAVVLYQTEPVTDKVQSRTLRAGIYTKSGALISDNQELTFDFSSENPRERELQIKLILSREADAADKQEVLLKLEEKQSGTTIYTEYKSIRYLLRRNFTSDFDF